MCDVHVWGPCGVYVIGPSLRCRIEEGIRKLLLRNCDPSCPMANIRTCIDQYMLPTTVSVTTISVTTINVKEL